LKVFLQITFLIVLLIVIGVYIVASTSESRASAQASIFYARGHLVEAQSQARLDLLAGLMPYTILGLGILSITAITIIVSLALFILLFVWMNRAEESPGVMLYDVVGGKK